MLETLRQILQTAAARWILALGAVLVGLAVAAFAARLAGRILTRTKDAHVGGLARKLTFYGLVVALFFLVLQVLKVEMTAFLAAAGILGIALGFASQTSVSNVISGLFLIFEGSFKVGDVIRAGDVAGTVLSIDLLSIKLRTFDNLLVRIPNEVVIRSNLTNLTRYEIRRLDLPVAVAYAAPLERAREALQEALEAHPQVLKKPDPTVYVDALADSGVTLIARVWVDRTEFLDAKSAVLVAMKEALDRAGIEIPFPHRKLIIEPRPLDLAAPGQKPA